MKTVQAQAGAKTMAPDPKMHQVFLSVADVAGEGKKGKALKPGSFGFLAFGQ